MMFLRGRRITALGFAVGLFVVLGNTLVVQAGPTAGPTFWAWCWSPTAQTDRNLIPMIWVRRSGYGNAAGVAAQARAIPRGKVAMFLWNAAPTLLTSPLDTCRTPTGKPTSYPSPWLARGAARIGRQMAQFFRRYKAAGGRLNYLVLDYEAGLGSWSMTKANLRAISADPRSGALKKKLGFSNLLGVGTSAGGPCSERCRRIWNEMMGHIVTMALDHAIYQPARSVYSHILASNYASFRMLGLIAPDDNGYYQPSDIFFGNVQSPSYYNRIAWGLKGWLATQTTGGSGPFATLRYELVSLQAIQRSSDASITPWISYKSYVKNNPYYKELIYQLALRGVDHFLYWNPRAWLKNQKPMTTAQDDTAVNNCLRVLNEKLGRTPGKAVRTGPITWNSALLVAARKTSAGRILYRVTVPPGTRAILVDPGHKRIVTRGKVGVWVRSPATRPLTFMVSH